MSDKKLNDTSVQKFPLILKLIQATNYLALTICIIGMFLYGLLPSNNEFLLMDGREPINKAVVSILFFVLALTIATTIHLIRERMRLAPRVASILILLSMPISEISNYFANNLVAISSPDRLWYLIDFAIILYLLKSKRVRALMTH